MATEVLLYLVIVLLIMQVVFIGIVINLQMKHKRMQAKYQIFMRGKDGKSLEKGFLEQFKTVEKLERAVKQNTRDIDTIYKRMKTHYQKIGIVRYDAFQEMGGNLSFVLTMLDENNNFPPHTVYITASLLFSKTLFLLLRVPYSFRLL